MRSEHPHVAPASVRPPHYHPARLSLRSQPFAPPVGQGHDHQSPWLVLEPRCSEGHMHTLHCGVRCIDCCMRIAPPCTSSCSKAWSMMGICSQCSHRHDSCEPGRLPEGRASPCAGRAAAQAPWHSQQHVTSRVWRGQYIAQPTSSTSKVHCSAQPTRTPQAWHGCRARAPLIAAQLSRQPARASHYSGGHVFDDQCARCSR